MSEHDRRGRAAVGEVIDPLRLQTISGDGVAIPDRGGLVHLQFRRFAGCPVCSLHLHSVAARHDEIAAAGVREVVLFHSSAKSLRAAGAAELPFAVVADPDKDLYRRFGVESSWRSIADPRAWRAEIRGLLARLPKPSLNLRGGPLGLPADLLVAPDGSVVANRYGTHADDQWTVDELLDLARNFGPVSRP